MTISGYYEVANEADLPRRDAIDYAYERGVAAQVRRGVKQRPARRMRNFRAVDGIRTAPEVFVPGKPH